MSWSKCHWSLVLLLNSSRLPNNPSTTMLMKLNLAPVLRDLACVEAELKIIPGASVTWDRLFRKRNGNRSTISICQNVSGTLQPNSVRLSFCLDQLFYNFPSTVGHPKPLLLFLLLQHSSWCFGESR